MLTCSQSWCCSCPLPTLMHACAVYLAVLLLLLDVFCCCFVPHFCLFVDIFFCIDARGLLAGLSTGLLEIGRKTAGSRSALGVDLKYVLFQRDAKVTYLSENIYTSMVTLYIFKHAHSRTHSQMPRVPSKKEQ